MLYRIFTIALLSVLLSVPAVEAQVTITSTSDFCAPGGDCSFDVWANTSTDLGRLVIVLRYDNSQINVTSIDDHHYMPVTSTLSYWDDICTVTILCDAPGPCGQISYIGLDSGNNTSGHRRVLTVHYTLASTTTPSWGPCPAWCNASICVSPVPFAGNYDGSNSQTMTWQPGTLTYVSSPGPDSDGDGLSDDMELLIGTDPFDADSDDDGLVDGLDPTPENGRTAAGEDADLDGYIAPWETDPNDADSDDDGLFDGTETGLAAPQTVDTDLGAGAFIADADPLTTTDPVDPDSDDDGALDGVEDANGNGAVDLGEANPGDGASVPVLEDPVADIAVLLLGDSDATAQVRTAIENAGHSVTVVDPYYSWDGVTPSVDDFGVVVLLDGYDYGYALSTGGASALADFVADGGGLVVTEWTAYDICYDYKNGPWTDAVPVSSAPDCDYRYGATWSITGSHELTVGLPASFTESDEGVSLVEPQPGAIVLVRAPDGVPLLTYSDRDGGRVVHLNNTLTYSTASVDPNVLSVIVNAVGYANTKRLFSDGFESGDTSAWSAAR